MRQRREIPQHIAIIMDGNGRWAKRQGKSRSEGHFAGMNALHVCVENAAASGVKYLTVYAFSTENWGRPQAEVDALMELVCTGVEMHTPELKKQGVSVKIIGDKSRFSQKVNEGSAMTMRVLIQNGNTRAGWVIQKNLPEAKARKGRQLCPVTSVVTDS